MNNKLSRRVSSITSLSFRETSFSTEVTYNAMIEQNYFKKLRNRFFFLFAFVDTVPINFFTFHVIISFWRLLQFIGPSLVASYPGFWGLDGESRDFMNVFSVFFHLIPPGSRRQASIIIEFLYSAIILATFIFLVFYSIYFRKTAKLADPVAQFIICGINGFYHLLHPIMLQSNGESIGRLINNDTYYGQAAEVSAVILSLLALSAYFFFFAWISSVSFVFRPYSLMTITSGPQVAFSILIWLVTFIAAVASQLSQIPRIILTAVTAILYFTGNLFISYPGSFVSDVHKCAVIGVSTTGGIFLILVIVYDILDFSASMIEIFVIIGLLIIIILAAAIILKNNKKKTLAFLDEIYENNTDIYQINKLTEARFLNSVITGFVNSHPLCTDWSFFKQGADRYDDSIRVWEIFGKFVAIYPEESNLLSFIMHKIQTNKNKGYIALELMSQAQSIMTQREGSLSYELKLRLSKASKQVQVTKRKIRHIWDLAIQSSINEMDSSINSTYNSKNMAAANFAHLLAQYPNNRFVARLYARFVLDILGDHQQHLEWAEKVRSLQRGKMINSDRTNILGRQAFPMLPAITTQQARPEIHYMDSEANESNLVMDFEDPFSQAKAEQITILQERINNISIPAINCIRGWICILYFLLVLVPAIAMLIYAPTYLNGLTSPLDLMYHISYIRASAFEIPLFAQHYMCENTPNPLNSSVNIFPVPDFNNMTFQSYGHSSTTDAQLNYLLLQTANSVQELSNYRTFELNDPNIFIVHDILFDELITYSFYDNNLKKGTANVSLQAAAMQIIHQASDFLFDNTIDKNNMLGENFSNLEYIFDPINNVFNVTDACTVALDNLRAYLITKHNDIENVILFAMVFICIIYAVTIIGIMIYQVESLRLTKSQIYQCLTSLPKNVVSTVADSLRIVEHEDESYEEDEDASNILNKQEENILKVFSSASDLTLFGSSERITYVILNIVFLICVLVIIILICEMFPTFTQQLRDNAPHLDYVLGTVAYATGALESLETLTLITYYDPSESQLRTQEEQIYTRLSNFSSYFSLARYGGENDGESGYQGFQAAHDNAMNSFTCENQTRIPDDFEGIYNCFSVDLLLNLIEPFIITLLLPLTSGESQMIDSHDEKLTSLWIIIIKVSDQLFYPMFREIVNNMRELINSSIPSLSTPAILLLVVCFFTAALIFSETIKTEDKLKFSLSLLLHCPPEVVMQTNKIMDVLSGDFTTKSREGMARRTDFFDSILKNVPDSVIVLNDQLIVESMNRATERIYGITPEEFVGQNVKTFFNTTSGKFSKNVENAFAHPNTHKSNSNQPGSELKTTTNIEFKTGQDNWFLEITTLYVKNHIVLTTRDQTQTVSYNTLIAEEKSKSDALLASILPPNLISRVQNGEENISFSVQSASICFMDIVEFTPWCAANTASMIMSTLNLMFKYFDSSLATHSTLTKIKCIGDCYMAAGGIFVEVNQPSVHAKEMIEFGLEAIQNVRRINEERNQTLRIRVGVNTGGPIVAGVLGIGKPTFEILGPAINMAQQMEHHGVPMQVHISRSSYELIYGGTFNVKERGQIEIKNGTVRTYLVRGKGEL